MCRSLPVIVALALVLGPSVASAARLRAPRLLPDDPPVVDLFPGTLQPALALGGGDGVPVLACVGAGLGGLLLVGGIGFVVWATFEAIDTDTLDSDDGLLFFVLKVSGAALLASFGAVWMGNALAKAGGGGDGAWMDERRPMLRAVTDERRTSRAVPLALTWPVARF